MWLILLANPTMNSGIQKVIICNATRKKYKNERSFRIYPIWQGIYRANWWSSAEKFKIFHQCDSNCHHTTSVKTDQCMPIKLNECHDKVTIRIKTVSFFQNEAVFFSFFFQLLSEFEIYNPTILQWLVPYQIISRVFRFGVQIKLSLYRENI